MTERLGPEPPLNTCSIGKPARGDGIVCVLPGTVSVIGSLVVFSIVNRIQTGRPWGIRYEIGRSVARIPETAEIG
ncbi:MAG: hypothetical protein IID38_12525 [Planctomycetes bacterium]|nr:hypothetical protein [Planctomycetota bacterium]